MPTPSSKSLVGESRAVERAVRLIELGARLQVLESETDLSYEKLLRLYKEVAGKSPSKGQLPFSTDWFLSWQPNIHASLYANLADCLDKRLSLEPIEVVMKAYKLYDEQMRVCGIEPLLSLTRAWRLGKFLAAGMLGRSACTSCGGTFVTDIYQNPRYFVCGLCKPPARAGKGRVEGSLRTD